jgi:hypothetical protein
MANVFTENWEGAGNGVAVLVSNTSFSHIIAGSGLTHSNLHVVSGQGSEGGRFVATANNQVAQATFTAVAKMFVSMMFRMTGAPDSDVSLLVAKGAASTTFIGYLVITTDRRIKLKNSGGSQVVASPASTVPVNSDGRLEWMIDTAADTQRVRWFNTATGNTADWDSGVLSTTAVGTIDTLNIGPSTAVTWEGFLGDVIIDDAGWPNFGGGGGGGTIAHRASAAAQISGTGSTVSVVVPASVAAGDQLILEFISGNNSSTNNSAPAGWTKLPISQTAGAIKMEAWKRTAVGGDAGSTVTVTSTGTTGTNARNLHINAYSGGAIVGNSSSAVATVATTAHNTPPVTAVSPNAWVHCGAADRNAPGSTNFTASTGLTKRSETYIATGSSAVSSAAASDDVVGSGSVPTYTFTGTISQVNAVMWAIVLEPIGTVTPVTVNVPSDIISEPYLAVAITPVASGTVTSWSWQQVTASDSNAKDITVGATVDVDGTIHITLPAAITEITYTLRALAHVTGVSPDAFDDIQIVVYPSTRQYVMPDGTIVPLRIQRVT